MNPGFLSRRSFPAILLILLAGILVYANTFQVPFVLDDLYVIVQNPGIRGLANFSHVNSPVQQILLPRIIAYFSFALNYQFGGLHVAGYHLVNLIIHLISGLLVYVLLHLTFQTPYLRERAKGSGVGVTLCGFVPLFAALLFIVHPVQTQAITYIVQRMASLAAMFYLLSVVLYVIGRLHMENGEGKAISGLTILFIGGSVAAALMAMKTKENSFTLPLAIVLYEGCFFRGAWKRRIFSMLPLLATLPVVPLGIFANGKGSGQLLVDLSEKTLAAGKLTRLEYLVTQFRVVVTYIRLLIFPANQNLDYDYPVYQNFFTPPVYLSFLLLVFILGLAIFLIWRTRSISPYSSLHDLPSSIPDLNRQTSSSDPALRLIAFGIFWFFLTLAVESSIVPIADVIAEHRLYLPSFGAAAAFSTAIALLFRKLFPRSANGKVLVLGAALLILVLGFASYQRNQVWGNKILLWQDAVSKSPNKARPYNNLGNALIDAGRIPEAIKVLSRAIAIAPLHPSAYNNLGLAYIKSDQNSAAVPLLKRAIGLDLYYADAYINLAAAYNQLRQFALTVALLEQRLDRNDWLSERVEAHYQLGVAYAFLGNFEGAKRKLAVVNKAGASVLAADLVRLLGKNAGHGISSGTR